MHVVRDGRPDRQRGHAGRLDGVAEDGEDAHRALVRAALEAELTADVGVVAAHEDGDRPGVRDVGEHRPEEHHGGDRVDVHEVDDLGRESAPAARRLGAEEDEDLGLDLTSADAAMTSEASGAARSSIRGQTSVRPPSSSRPICGRLNW